MKLALAIVVLVVFALSLWADHKWRQWIKKRDSGPSDPAHPETEHPGSTHPSP